MGPTPAPSQLPTVSAAPTATRLLACDFDSSTCGFDYTADYDWLLDADGTPSLGTGQHDKQKEDFNTESKGNNRRAF